jgi:cytochrome c oxidase subunit 1
MMNEGLGKLHFFITFIGVNAIFIPFHVMGLVGAPRRYSTHNELKFLESVMPLHRFVSIMVFITIGAQFIFLFNLLWSLVKGKKAGNNPWEATSLEWTVTSPPPFDNFAGVEPVVYRGPYEYSVPGEAKDYCMQSEPPGAAVHGD